MTKSNPEEQFSTELSEENSQQQPFQIVLVDIKEAARNDRIRCVKKPLEGNPEELAYVALSYRWGELQETLIDTKVGYIASLTSFALRDFCSLCYTMTMETDLRHINYVWVDAICVDQTNAKRRKETIYKMSKIYERASYILAVPDLQLQFLKDTGTKAGDIISQTRNFEMDIYHLLHGNIEEVKAYEKIFLDDLNVPKDPALRQLLTQHTDHFVHGFMYYKEHNDEYEDVKALDHIYETSQTATMDHLIDCNDDQAEEDMATGKTGSFKGLHHCTLADCPLELFNKDQEFWRYGTYSRWSRLYDCQWQRRIIERSTIIRQSMEFLLDLINDWSSRVWVISEYSIAKKKNNLKYWFIQLAEWGGDQACSFFKFDFDNPLFSSTLSTNLYSMELNIDFTRMYSSNPVFTRFHCTMIRQLKQKSFLEMMLASKATKNEDRFYSILPLSEYNDKHFNKTEMDQWNINTMLSVKLQLYKMMNTEDKLNLLLWSVDPYQSMMHKIRPTFATSTLRSPYARIDYLAYHKVDLPCNFDLTDDSSAITLHRVDKDDDDEDKDLHRYYLSLKPMEYYVNHEPRNRLYDHPDTLYGKQGLYNLVGIDVDHDTYLSPFNMVCIPAFNHKGIVQNEDHVQASPGIILYGSFTLNKWLIMEQIYNEWPRPSKDLKWSLHDNHNGHNDITFNIY
ncbi:unnamed protein product [Absidia cylindrospora]